jgi:hypothetical protein
MTTIDRRDFLKATSALAAAFGLRLVGSQEAFAKEGSPYADTFIAVLPTDRNQRCLIFGLYNEERATERLPPEDDDDREELEFWWD